ncbi:MAG: Trm112 family protein [Sumerlaeia bacterium]
MATTLPRELLDILICPETRAPLVVDAQGHLVSTDAACRRRYSVEDGIPNMLIEDAEVLSESEHAEVLAWAKANPDAQPAATRAAWKSAGAN